MRLPLGLSANIVDDPTPGDSEPGWIMGIGLGERDGVTETHVVERIIVDASIDQGNV